LSNAKILSLDDLPSPALIVNAVGIIDQANTAVELLTGYSKEEILLQNIEFLLPQALKEQHLQYRSNYQQNYGELAHSRDVTLRTKSGLFNQVNVRIAEIDSKLLVIINEHDNVISNYHHQALDETHQVVKALDEPYWEWDIIEDAFFYSAKMMAFLGYKAETFTGRRDFWCKHLSASTLKEIYQQVEQYLYQSGDGLNITSELITKQGDKKWVQLSGKVVEFKDEKPSRMIGSMRNVTEAKELVATLKKQNDYLMLAERISNSGHWRYDFVADNCFWSPEIYRIYGLNRAKFKPSLENILAFQPEHEQNVLRELFTKAQQNAQGFHHKGTLIKRSGKKIKIEITAEVEVNKQGNVIALFGICRDVTKAEDVIEKVKLLAMVNFTINVPIFFVDEQDNIVYQDISSHHGQEQTGLFNYVNFSITKYLEFKKLAKQQGQFKKQHLSFDKFNSVFNISVTHEAQEGIYIWIVENVTEQFRKEQQQIISNRLALLGNTFGNVSHDINNVLGVALGAIEMLELKFSKGDQNITTYIERVKNAIDKGKSVTERLLAFTRKPVVKVVDFDPVEDIEKNKYLFKQLLLNTINISFDYNDTQCLIRFPQGEFINILLNIVLNAQDAIQENGLSGKIEISTNINEDRRLEVHIKDSGVGIEEENLARIFDPFYSSKSINKGNGIGLANVFNTMYKHNGEIKVEGHSDLGGAHFILIFKCDVSPRLLDNDNTHAAMGLAEKRVLVLDDEISIGEFVALYLENHGAIATCLSNKTQLLALLETEQEFDVFITDMIMPDLSGREAVNLVKERYPDIIIYSMSGYIAIEDRKWEYPVLRKPFNSRELAEFLERV
jgi:PAS domain S-box-containing protein